MQKRITKNLTLKILAFLIAVFLWLIVVNIDDPVDDKTFSNIPVQVTHEEVITDNNNTYQIVDNTQEVNVTVTAQRSVLDKIKAEDIQATADMKELTLRTQVPIEITIKGYAGKYEKATANPRNLQIQIDEEAKNNFPITPTTTGTVRGGYEVGALKAVPEKVTLRGPKRIINSIAKVTAEADVSGLSEDETVEAKLVLYDANNNVIDQTLLANNLGKEGVSVEVELLQVKSVPIEVDTSDVSAAEGYKLGKITVEPQEVEITGDKTTLAGVSKISIPASALQLDNLTQKTDKTIDISSLFLCYSRLEKYDEQGLLCVDILNNMIENNITNFYIKYENFWIYSKLPENMSTDIKCLVRITQLYYKIWCNEIDDMDYKLRMDEIKINNNSKFINILIPLFGMKISEFNMKSSMNFFTEYIDIYDDSPSSNDILPDEYNSI